MGISFDGSKWIAQYMAKSDLALKGMGRMVFIVSLYDMGHLQFSCPSVDTRMVFPGQIEMLGAAHLHIRTVVSQQVRILIDSLINKWYLEWTR